MRTFGAVVAGLLAAAIVAVVTVGVSSPRDLLHSFAGLMLIGSPFAVVGGLLGALALRFEKLRRVWVFGLGAGLLVAPTSFWQFAAAGAVGGVVFWWFAVRLRGL